MKCERIVKLDPKLNIHYPVDHDVIRYEDDKDMICNGKYIMDTEIRTNYRSQLELKITGKCEKCGSDINDSWLCENLLSKMLTKFVEGFEYE